MVIRNPTTGAVTYRSDLKYMRIVQIQGDTMPPPSKFGANGVALSRSGLAVVIANPGCRIDQETISTVDPITGEHGQSTQYTPYQLATNVNGTTLYLNSNDTRFTTQNSSNDSLNLPWTLFLIDVSDFDI